MLAARSSWGTSDSKDTDILFVTGDCFRQEVLDWKDYWMIRDHFSSLQPRYLHFAPQRTVCGVWRLHKECNPRDGHCADGSRYFHNRCLLRFAQYKIESPQGQGPYSSSSWGCADIYNDSCTNLVPLWNACCRGRCQTTTSQTVLCSQSCVPLTQAMTWQTWGLYNSWSMTVCR